MGGLSLASVRLTGSNCGNLASSPSHPQAIVGIRGRTAIKRVVGEGKEKRLEQICARWEPMLSLIVIASKTGFGETQGRKVGVNTVTAWTLPSALSGQLSQRARKRKGLKLG